MTRSVVWISSVICLFACGDKKEAGTEPPDTPPADPGASAESPDPSVKPAKLPAGLLAPSKPGKAPDALYLATAETLLAIQGGEFVKVADLPKYFRAADITFDADGALWVLGGDAVAKLEGKQFSVIKLSDGNGALKTFAVHGGDNIDVVGVYGISHFDGTGWTLAKSDDLLGPSSGGIQGLVMDSSGRGYASAFKRLLIRQDKLWKALPEDEHLYSAMDIGADGTLAVATSRSVLLTDGDAWRTLETDCSSPKRLALRGDKIFLVCFDKMLTIDRKSSATRSLDLGKGGPLDVDRIDAADVDASGRVYIGASAGFFVVLPDGTVKAWKLGSVPLMASGPRAILASGAGADKLPGEAKIRYGAVRGKLFKKGKPLARVPVELCTNTSSFIKPGQTPCSEANWKTGGTTGADGSFSFPEVPIGALEFAYKPAGADKWTLVIGFDCCAELEEGGKHDVGVIDMM